MKKKKRTPQLVPITVMVTPHVKSLIESHIVHGFKPPVSIALAVAKQAIINDSRFKEHRITEAAFNRLLLMGTTEGDIFSINMIGDRKRITAENVYSPEEWGGDKPFIKFEDISR